MPENYISISGEKGSVNISENVIAVIASAAAAEVEGIAGLSNSVGSELYESLGRKTISRGVNVCFDDGSITVDVIVMVRYGWSISRVASQAQSAVASAVSSMTGMSPRVNIHVSGVALDK